MKKKKMRITLTDFILANRRASRAEEIEKYGQQVHNRRMVHKSKKKYDRKAMKRAVIKGDDSSYYFVKKVTYNSLLKVYEFACAVGIITISLMFT